MSLRTLACSNSRKGHVRGGCLPRQSVFGINFKTTETRVANSIHPRRVFLDESYNDDESLWEKTGAFLGLGSQRDTGICLLNGLVNKVEVGEGIQAMSYLNVSQT